MDIDIDRCGNRYIGGLINYNKSEHWSVFLETKDLDNLFFKE